MSCPLEFEIVKIPGFFVITIMKTYEYKGYDSAGHACKGLVEAESVKNAREKLALSGILAERLSQTGRHVRFPVSTRAMVYREISTLLGAGLTLVRALDVLIESAEMGTSNVLLAGVRDKVKEGESLANALSEASHSMTSYERAIIESAEKSATVELMLERLACFLEEQQEINDKIQAALIYPSIVVTMGICVAVLMLGFLLPRTNKILDGSEMILPWLTRFMVQSGQLMMKWGWLLLVGIFVASGYLRNRLKSDSDFKVRWDKALFNLPLWGRGYTILVNLRFSRTLSILLGGGVSLMEGLALAGRATGSAWIGSLAEAGAESVRHGSSLSDVIRKIGPFSSSLAEWIQVGEASGGLDRILDSAGDRYQARWNRFVSTSISFLEPVLILLIGGFVLLVTLSILLPIMALTRMTGGV